MGQFDDLDEPSPFVKKRSQGTAGNGSALALAMAAVVLLGGTVIGMLALWPKESPPVALKEKAGSEAAKPITKVQPPKIQAPPVPPQAEPETPEQPKEPTGPPVLGAAYFDALAADLAAWRRAKDISQRDSLRGDEPAHRAALEKRYDEMRKPGSIIEWRFVLTERLARPSDGVVRVPVDPPFGTGIVWKAKSWFVFSEREVSDIAKGDIVTLRAEVAGVSCRPARQGRDWTYRATVSLGDVRIVKPTDR